MKWIAQVTAAFSALGLLAAPEPELALSPKTDPLPRPRMEICFVLDTTGSMGGLIEGAKQKIWSIANSMASAKPTPEIRIGLVAYRDRGDEYVTRRVDLTNDIDSIYGQLQSFRADGGGDVPESVNEALDEAVRKMSWSQDRKVLKIIFLVGDAPPHMDYAGGPKYPEICQQAVKKDLLINTIQCGDMPMTGPIWKEIAQLGEGGYAAIAQSGNMRAIPTPMDTELAELNRKLGRTLVAYGGERTRSLLTAKQAAAEAAPASVAADRLSFNMRSGVAVQGDGELLDGLNQGKLKVESLNRADLPKDLQSLSQKDLEGEIEKRQKDRSEIQARIQSLSKEREAFLAKERARLAEQGKGDSFDEKVATIVREEAARKGI